MRITSTAKAIGIKTVFLTDIMDVRKSNLNHDEAPEITG